MRELMATFPELTYGVTLTPEDSMWLARAYALVKEILGVNAAVQFAHHQSQLGAMLTHQPSVDAITALVFRSIAIIELELPANAQGAFIAAGNVFDAITHAGRIFESAETDCFIVDPYLDAKILTDFAPFIPEGVKIRLLGDAKGVRETLRPVAQAWVAQHGNKRPLEIRATEPRKLHDRLIFIDGKEVWLIGQSFNALAKRSPTSFTKADKETAKLKIDAYTELWDWAQPY